MLKVCDFLMYFIWMCWHFMLIQNKIKAMLATSKFSLFIAQYKRLCTTLGRHSCITCLTRLKYIEVVCMFSIFLIDVVTWMILNELNRKNVFAKTGWSPYSLREKKKCKFHLCALILNWNNCSCCWRGCALGPKTNRLSSQLIQIKTCQSTLRN